MSKFTAEAQRQTTNRRGFTQNGFATKERKERKRVYRDGRTSRRKVADLEVMKQLAGLRREHSFAQAGEIALCLPRCRNTASRLW